MEAEWMKNISSETVCNFFYIFFVVNAVFVALAILGLIGMAGFAKKLGMGGIATGFYGVLLAALAATQTLFFYLICDRALLASKAAPAPKQIGY